MASKFPSASNVQFKSRKGHDMTWSCDKHGEPIKFYCEVHDIPICHPCATRDHGQKPCELRDIEDVILDMAEKIDDKLLEIVQTEPHLKKLGSEIKHCANVVSDHFQLINEHVHTACEGQIKNLTGKEGKEQEEIRLINEEADEEIRIINEKRETRIKECLQKVDRQEKKIKEMQAKLVLECKEMYDTVGNKIEVLRRRNQHRIDTVNTISQKLKRIKQDDKALVTETRQVIASMGESLSANVDQDTVDYLARIQREVQEVKLLDGQIGGEYFARIDGQAGKWELVKLIPIPPTVNGPMLRGVISDEEMCILDSKTNDLYVTNMTNGNTEKVIEGDAKTSITSCAAVGSDFTVCGKRRFDCQGGHEDGCITLYDRQWRRVRDIVKPEENMGHNELWVDVDRDGMIMTGQEGDYNVYVINPDDGKTVDAIELPDLNVHDGIQTLSTGDFVTCIGYADFMVFDRSGSTKDELHDRDWGSSFWLSVDKLTDTIYITYKDVREIYVVDQVSCDRTIKAQRVVEFTNPLRSFQVGPSFITPSGSLINCDGNKLLVYKKSLSV